jgi:hypothetical protein
VTRYAAGQLALAFTLAALGAVKGYRLLVDEIDSALSSLTGLS